MANGDSTNGQWPMATNGHWPMAIGHWPNGHSNWPIETIESIDSIGQEVKPIPKVKRPGLIYQSKYNHPVWPM